MNSLIRQNSIQVLDENRNKMSILDYFKQNKTYDPNFFNWLIVDSDNISDFGVGMTKEQSKAVDEFEDSIIALNEVRKYYSL